MIRGIVDYGKLPTPQLQSLDSLLNAATAKFDCGRMSQGCCVLRE